MAEHYVPRTIKQDWEPTPAALGTILDALCSGHERHAGALTPERTLAILARVSERWLDPETPARRAAETALVREAGYSPANVRAALDDLFAGLRAPALRQLLAVEWPDLPVTRPALVLHVPAGTVFPPAIVGPIATLLLGAPCLVRPSRRIAALPARWAATLADEDPLLGERLAVLPWERERTELTGEALARASTAVLHGDDATLTELVRLAPTTTHIVPHGHRVSVAVVGGAPLAADAPALARGLARDAALYDQQGCLSPHMVLVIDEAADHARDFAHLLARECERWATLLPPGATARAGWHPFLAARELEAYAGEEEMLGGEAAGWAVFRQRPEATRCEFSPGGRILFVAPVATVPAAAEILRPVLEVVTAIGVALADEDRRALATALGDTGELESAGRLATPRRYCEIGAMQRPPVTWPADGLRPLVSLCPTAAA